MERYIQEFKASDALLEELVTRRRQEVEALQKAEAERLRRAIVKVLRRAIERRGSSIRDYVGGSGRRGSYQREFRVYGRAGEPCIRCQSTIERIRLAGRSTHYCPKCQFTEE